MAVITRREVVCDEGRERCDNTVLHNVSVIIDGQTSKQVLCVKHAAPYVRLQEKMGGAKTRGRGRVYTQEEIAAKKRTSSRKAT